MKKDDLTVMRILYLLQKHKNSLNSYIISNKNKQRINFKNRKYNFEFKKLKNLNNENMFSELETNCISYLLNNDENNVGKESLGLRNSYAHNIIYYETRIKENQNNF